MSIIHVYSCPSSHKSILFLTTIFTGPPSEITGTPVILTERLFQPCSKPLPKSLVKITGTGFPGAPNKITGNLSGRRSEAWRSGDMIRR